MTKKYPIFEIVLSDEWTKEQLEELQDYLVKLEPKKSLQGLKMMYRKVLTGAKGGRTNKVRTRFNIIKSALEQGYKIDWELERAQKEFSRSTYLRLLKKLKEELNLDVRTAVIT